MFKEEKDEIIKSVKEELAMKNDELREAIKEKYQFEEKVNSLLDVLYGCPECDLYECECKDSPDRDYSMFQGVIFPAGVRVFPARKLQNPQEILTKTLIIEQIL